MSIETPVREEAKELPSIDAAEDARTETRRHKPKRRVNTPIVLAVFAASSVVAALACSSPESFASRIASSPRASGEPVPQTQIIVPVPPIQASVAVPQTADGLVTSLRSANDPSGLADALVALGSKRIVAGDAGRALAPIDEAIAIRTNQAKDALKLSDALFDKGWAILVEGTKRDTAAEPLNQSLSIRDRASVSSDQIAATLSLLSWAEREAGNKDGAVALSRRLVKLARTDSKLDLADAINSYGVNLIVAGDPRGAAKVLQESVNLRTKAGGAPLANSLQSLGWALLVSDAGNSSIAPLQRAVAIRTSEKIETPQLAGAIQLLASAQFRAKAYGPAVATQQRLVALARKGLAGATLADTLDTLGVAQVLAKDAPSAVTTLKEALSLREGPDNALLATTLHTYGWALLGTGDRVAAQLVLKRAVTMRDGLSLIKDADKSRDLLALATQKA